MSCNTSGGVSFLVFREAVGHRFALLAHASVIDCLPCQRLAYRAPPCESIPFIALVVSGVARWSPPLICLRQFCSPPSLVLASKLACVFLCSSAPRYPLRFSSWLRWLVYHRQRRIISSQLIEDIFNRTKADVSTHRAKTCNALHVVATTVDKQVISKIHRFDEVDRNSVPPSRETCLHANSFSPVYQKKSLDEEFVCQSSPSRLS